MTWLAKILDQEKASHQVFFGKKFDLSEFKTTLEKYGESQIKKWEDLLLEPHFLPKVEMKRKANFPGWKVRLTDHHYEVVYQGKVLRMMDGQLRPDKKAHWLSGETVLIDTRLKPAYRDGKQMWDQDTLLGPTMKNLRQANKISPYDYGSPSSRFGVSADEWETQVKSALARNKELGLTSKHWRLERGIEGHIISQIYMHMPRKDDGDTSTWVWYEEYFEGRSCRLLGGYSACGGLADFSWFWSGYRWCSRSFRPLAVL